jgi:prophage maintenance system killer protein
VIHLDLPEALAVAARVLDCDSMTIAELTDLDAVSETLAETKVADESEGRIATAAATLLTGLARRRPYPRRNRAVALATTVHFLARNGWDLRLAVSGETGAEEVADINRLLDAIATGQVSVAEVSHELQIRLTPTHERMEPPWEEHREQVRLEQEKGRHGMFERFTDRARRVTVLAQEEARELCHNYIGTEHLLLGLTREEQGIAAKALEALGVSPAGVREKVLEQVGRGDRDPDHHIPFTPRAKKVLEFSLREAMNLGHNYIGTEHILLGLVREGEGLAAKVLFSLGIELSAVREKVLELLGKSGAEPGGDERLGGTAEEFLTGGSGSGRRALIFRELKALFDQNDELVARQNELLAEVGRLRELLRRHNIDPDS